MGNNNQLVPAVLGVPSNFMNSVDDNVHTPMRSSTSGAGGRGANGKAKTTTPEGGSKATGRMNIAGKTHPVTGVEFDANGFPIFKSKYDMYLDSSDYTKSRTTHFRRASNDLYNSIQKDSKLASQFTTEEINLFKAGKVPENYTWHYHQDTGRMQLVDSNLHSKTGHNGGFSIWGPGNN